MRIYARTLESEYKVKALGVRFLCRLACTLLYKRDALKSNGSRRTILSLSIVFPLILSLSLSFYFLFLSRSFMLIVLHAG